MESLLLSWVPEKSPLKWFPINVTVFAFSAVLLFLTLYAEEDSRGHDFVSECYLVYNFVTTVIWCCEVGLSVWYHKGASSWETRIELAVAIYFVGDSAYVLYVWKIKKQDIDEVLLDVTINTVAYLYATIKGVQYRRRMRYVDVDEVRDLLLEYEDSPPPSEAMEKT